MSSVLTSSHHRYVTRKLNWFFLIALSNDFFLYGLARNIIFSTSIDRIFILIWYIINRLEWKIRCDFLKHKTKFSNNIFYKTRLPWSIFFNCDASSWNRIFAINVNSEWYISCNLNIRPVSCTERKNELCEG